MLHGEQVGAMAQEKGMKFTVLAKGGKTRVFFGIGLRSHPSQKYQEIAMHYYAADRDVFGGVQSWFYGSGEWAFVRYLGHHEAPPNWKTIGDDYFRKVSFTRLDDLYNGISILGSIRRQEFRSV